MYNYLMNIVVEYDTTVGFTAEDFFADRSEESTASADYYDYVDDFYIYAIEELMNAAETCTRDECAKFIYNLTNAEFIEYFGRMDTEKHFDRVQADELEVWEDAREYNRDPYGYNGLSRSDFF